MSNEEFNQIEQLEFNRRYDVALSIIPFAVEQIQRKTFLEKVAKEKERLFTSPWFWSVMGIGALSDWWLRPDGGFSWNIGSVIWFSGLCWYLIRGFEMADLHRQIYQTDTQIRGLAVHWQSAIVANTLWDLRRFITDDGFNQEGDLYLAWWKKQQSFIMERVKSPNIQKAFE